MLIKSKLYPNPVLNQFTIEFDNPKSELYQLSIYDINSKLVYTKENIRESKIEVDAGLF